MEVRHATEADVNEVIGLTLSASDGYENYRDGIFEEADAPHGASTYESLVESCFLSLVVVDEDGRTCGACCLNDAHPRYGGSDWLREELEVLGHAEAASHLYVTYLLLPRARRQQALAALARAAFSKNHAWQALLAVVPCTRRQDAARLLGGGFELLTQDEERVNLAVFECARSSFLSPVMVRRARVEDYDDLLPVLEAAAKRYPQLSTIPTDESDVQEFALARLISSTDPHRVVLVAERPALPLGAPRIEGMVVLSDQVDVERLASVYSLGEYGDLVELRRSSSTEPKPKRAMSVVDEAAASQPEPDEQPPELSGDALIEALARGQLEPSESNPPEEEEEEEEEEAAREEDSLGGDALLERLVAAQEAAEEEIRMADLQDAAGERVPKAVTMPMVCVDDALTDVADAFLTECFNCFPEKTYCTMSFPHGSAVPLMLSRFNAADTRLPEAGVDMLYVAHRRASLQAFEVRRAELSDMPAVEALLGARADRLEAFAAFHDALERGGVVLAHSADELVGLACVDTRGEGKDALLAAVLEAHAPRRVFDPRNTDERSVGVLRFFALGALFGVRRRGFLVETLRVLGLSCLLAEAGGGGEAPVSEGRSRSAVAEAVSEMVQLPAKEELPRGPAGQVPPLVYALSRRVAYRSRAKVNSRVVVVGASDAGLAAVEAMLVSTEFAFTSITLVCGGGPSHAAGSASDAARRAQLAKLSAEVSLRIIDDAEVVSLDRDGHSVGLQHPGADPLAEPTPLPYEVLLLTPDLRDQTCTGLGINAASARDAVMRHEDLAAALDARRAARTGCAAVYGNTVEAYRSLQHLLGHGVPAERIVWLRTPRADGLGDLVLDGMRRAGIAGPLLGGEGGVRCVHGATVTGLDVNEEDRVLVDYALAGGRAETLVCDLLVTCDAPNTDLNLFESINDSGIVYDGRVVVNARFQTNDRDVYAAGEVAKFSRRCAAGDVPLEHFNGRELGAKLAASLMDRFRRDGSSSIADLDMGPDEHAAYPSFSAPRCVAASVPGPARFFLVGRPEAFIRQADPGPEADQAAGALGRHVMGSSAADRCIWTDVDGYTCIMLDGEEGRVESVLYCGRMDVDPELMRKVIGLLPEHLNDMHNQYRAGAIVSLPKFLAQPWTDAVHHPEFLAFKRELYESVRACLADADREREGEEEEEAMVPMDGVEAPADAREARVIKLVQESMVDFIRAYKDDLPGYHLVTSEI